MNPVERILAVVGGGAAGLAGAIAAARVLEAAGAGDSVRVVVLEKGDRVGRKILATGNGRCNLGNARIEPNRYHGEDPRFAEPLLHAWPTERILAFFRSIGLLFHTEEDGKIYPMSLSAASVLDLLRLEMARLGVEERCGFPVAALRPVPEGLFRLSAPDGRSLFAHRVLVAAGGCAHPALGSDGSGHALLVSVGHRLVEPFPALVQLRCEPERVRSLQGQKVDAAVTLVAGDRRLREEFGEVLFTEYGLSGPPVLQVSRLAAGALREQPDREVRVWLDLLPDTPLPAWEATLAKRAREAPDRPLEHFLTGLLAKRLAHWVLREAGAAPLSRSWGSLSAGDIGRIAACMKRMEFRLVGTQSFQQAQVTAGGIRTSGFLPTTFESRRVPGLYAAGEVLDIDGDCGGFNLHWAWASGMAAGEAAARSLLGEG